MRALLLLGCALIGGPGQAGPPFVPADDGVVLEHLPKGWRTSAHPEALAGDATAALREARQLIGRSRSEADPRFLGLAQGVLQPWWNRSDAPADLLVLKATIRQSQHDFTGAIADLRQAVTADPKNAQGWITLATIHLVQGRYDDARRALLVLVRLADELTVTTLVAQLGSLTGHAQAAAEQLGAALQRHPNAEPTVRLWAQTTRAEIAARAGARDDAERYFRESLALSSTDPYLLAAYADYLLDHHREPEVLTQLASAPPTDGLLLRRALALKASGSADRRLLTSLIGQLDERFARSRARGEAIHGREESRFLLQLKDDPAGALARARANWEIQKEPADALVFLEAAAAAGIPSAAQSVTDFIRTNHLEDASLRPGSAPVAASSVAHP